MGMKSINNMLRKAVGETLFSNLSAVILLLAAPLLIVAMSMWLSFSTGESATKETSDLLISRARDDATSRVNELLEPVKSMVMVAASLGTAQNSYFRGDSSVGYMDSMLSNGHDLDSVYVAYMDGTFRQSLRVLPDTMIRTNHAPAGAVISHRLLDRSNNKDPKKVIDDYDFFDKSGTKIASMQFPPVYDPRVRPWFNDAVGSGGKLIVSDPYIYATTGLIGVTVAMPFYSEGSIAGVVACDVPLASVGAFLSARTISKGSITVIVDRNNDVVAGPDTSQWAVKIEGKLARKNLKGLDDVLGAAIRENTINNYAEKFQFIYEKDRKSYAAMFSNLPVSDMKTWQIVSVAPVSDFSEVWEKRSTTQLKYGVGLIVVMMAVLLPIAYRLDRIQRERVRAKDREANDIQAKHSFLISLNHELRNPITAISAAAEAIPIITDRAKLNAMVNAIYAGCQHILHTIGDVLDAERLSSGEVNLEVVDFSVIRLLEDVKTMYLAAASEAHASLRIKAGDCHPFWNGPAAGLRQVLMNLVSNAIKYAPGSIITLSCYEHGNSLILEVSDTGPGLSEFAKANLYKPFSSSLGAAGSSGLGLRISKVLVEERMNGQIQNESRPGQGCTFSVMVPLKKLKVDTKEKRIPAPVPIAAVQVPVISGAPIPSIQEGEIDAQIKPANFTKNESLDALKNKKILIVEDDPNNCFVLSMALGEYIKEVVTAETSQEAVERVRKGEHFDAALIDHNLGIKSKNDGIELTRILSSMGSKCLIGFTGNIAKELESRWMAAGVSMVIRKPVGSQAILDALKSQFQK